MPGKNNQNRENIETNTRGLHESRKVYSQQPLLCKDKDGLALADEERCIKRWTEYFEELLNPTRPPNRNYEDNDFPFQTTQPCVPEPTLLEREILSLKAPGTDNLPGELFKHGCVVYGNAWAYHAHLERRRIAERVEG